MIRARQTATFTRTLAILTNSAVPLVEALQVAGQRRHQTASSSAIFDAPPRKSAKASSLSAASRTPAGYHPWPAA